MMGLYQDVRPTTLDGLVGQPQVVDSLKKMLEEGTLPHALLLSGPSGTGKTTTARILKRQLKCSDGDFQEMNCADVRGIDDIRNIRSMMGYSPMGGKCRIWVIDEAHRLTKDAQEAAMKMLEDTPDHVYFIICTTEPESFNKTFRSRLHELRFNPLTGKVIRDLLESTIKVNKLEGPKEDRIDDDVIDAIIESADGSARQALVLLEQALALEDHEEQIKAVAGGPRAIQMNFCAEMLKDRPELKKMLAFVGTMDVEPEKVRRGVLGFFTSIAVKGEKTGRCATVMNCFKDNYFSSGKAGLVLSIMDFAAAEKK